MSDVQYGQVTENYNALYEKMVGRTVKFSG